MKKPNQILKASLKRLSQFHILIFFMVMATSCDNYNFLNPLPIDRKDMKTFPIDMQGEWIYLDSNKANSPSEGSNDSVILNIREKQIDYIVISHSKMVLGAWPKISSNGKVETLKCNCNPEIMVNTDSLDNPIDSSRNYLFTNGYLFAVENKNKLSQKLSYTRINDTFYVRRIDTLFLDLGPNMKLRSINDNWHALNIRKILLEESSKWWHLTMINQNGKDSLTTYEAASESNFSNKELIKLISSPLDSDEIYFDANWNSKELFDYIKDNHFSKLLTLKRISPKSANSGTSKK